jgi:hypothetical protein
MAAASLGPTPGTKPEATAAPGRPWRGLVATAAGASGPSVSAQHQAEWNGHVFGFIEQQGPDGRSFYALAAEAGGSWTAVTPQIAGPLGGFVAAGSSTAVAIQAGGDLVNCNADGMACSTGPIEIWTSADGSSWTAAGTLPGSTGLIVGYLVYGPAGFLAGSSQAFDGKPAPAMWASKDGSTWREVSLPATFANAAIDGVAAIPGGYLAYGGVGRVNWVPGYMGTLGGSVAAWWSNDGVHWTRSAIEVPHGGAQQMGPIYALEGGLFAGGFVVTDGDNGPGYVHAAWSSVDDGKTWQYHAVDTVAEGRVTFEPQIPVAREGLLAGDGHRLISIPLRLNADGSYQDATVAGAWETLDGASWHPLPVEAFDYVNDVAGSNWASATLTVDETGVLIAFPATPGYDVVRLWAVAAP